MELAKKAALAEVRGNFEGFLGAKPSGKPFCYCFGPTNTHGGKEPGSGKLLWGIDPDQLQGKLPGCLPDVPVVREDVSDYLGECSSMDGGLGELLAVLKEKNELENTVIIITGDHGINLPRAKANQYDLGCQVPLAISWPSRVPKGRVVEDFVNTMDLCPTILEAAGVPLTGGVTAASLLPLLISDRHGQVEAARDFVVSGLERHVSIARETCLGYPQRSIRTKEWLYIINYKSDRWPVGDPHGIEKMDLTILPEHDLADGTMLAYPDTDGTRTKAWMIENRNKGPSLAHLFQLAFGKRPREELYRVAQDPSSLHNLAEDVACRSVKEELHARLYAHLVSQADPRVTEDEHACRYDAPPFSTIMEKYTKEKGVAFLERMKAGRLKWQNSSSKL